MIRIGNFIEGFSNKFKDLDNSQPWDITNNLKNTLEKIISTLNQDYMIQGNVAIHKSATVENGVTIKKPAISVNFEAGSIAVNHDNEREFKKISVLYNAQIIETNSEKFGSLVGDNSKIGANAVLSPGTILIRNSIVKRLQLVEQIVAK